jgi:hypothetical protein
VKILYIKCVIYKIILNEYFVDTYPIRNFSLGLQHNGSEHIKFHN